MNKPIKAWGGFNSHGELYPDPCIFKEKKNAESKYGIVKGLLVIPADTKAEIVRRLDELPMLGGGGGLTGVPDFINLKDAIAIVEELL